MPLSGGVSRPSVKQWTYTLRRPRAAAIVTQAKRCSSRECTPASLASPMTCSRLRRAMQVCTAATISAFDANDPSRTARLMRTDS